MGDLIARGLENADKHISGVIFEDLNKFKDERGWLMELFRHDELIDQCKEIPVMMYVSMTNPSVTRGPHEHFEQADHFFFIGPGIFRLYLWDNRIRSSTYKNKIVTLVGEDKPTGVIIPPGVVHAYKNISDVQGMVYNAPDKLYAGQRKKYPVDEFRWEDNSGKRLFKMDDV